MIKPSFVNPITEDFVKKAHKIMRNKGYKLKTTKQSAEVEYSYVKPGQSYYEGVSICGWHGDGRYGNLKLMMDVYNAGKLKEDIFLMPSATKGQYGQGMPDIKRRGEDLTEEEFAAYKENIKKALDFLEAL